MLYLVIVAQLKFYIATPNELYNFIIKLKKY